MIHGFLGVAGHRANSSGKIVKTGFGSWADSRNQLATEGADAIFGKTTLRYPATSQSFLYTRPHKSSSETHILVHGDHRSSSETLTVVPERRNSSSETDIVVHGDTNSRVKHTLLSLGPTDPSETHIPIHSPTQILERNTRSCPWGPQILE